MQNSAPNFPIKKSGRDAFAPRPKNTPSHFYQIIRDQPVFTNH
jgi:hypothetical protein